MADQIPTSIRSSVKHSGALPTAADFMLAVRTFEASFKTCLDALLAVKSGEVNDGACQEQFQTFQPRLYGALLKLSREYQRLRVARKGLIERKKQVTQPWFNRRQRVLADRQQALLRAIRAGRILGDAFIWFFYRNDPDLLDQHIRQPNPSPPPSGIGGDGELAFVGRVRKFGDKYILFHGISSLFRLGDASLYDFKRQRIVGIGELKTVRVSENVLDLHFEARVLRDAPIDFGSAKAAPETPSSTDTGRRITTSQDRRLKQQLATIARATTAADRQPDQRLEFSIPHMAHASELNALVQEARVGRFTYRQVGPGLLLVAYGERRRSLSSILLGEGGSIPQGALSDLPEKAISLVLRGSPYNCILVNSPFHSGPWEPVLMPGTTPFFWWPLDVSVLRAMALGRRIVTSVYNPAHLFAEVVRRGFTVERFKPPDDFALALSDGTRKLTVENVIYFLHLVSVSLLSEEYVVDVISRIASETYRRGDRSGRVNLQFVHDMLGGGSRKQRASGERMPGAVMLSERRAGR